MEREHDRAFLEGWWEGSRAYPSPEDALPLQRELAAAFDDEDIVRCDDRGLL